MNHLNTSLVAIIAFEAIAMIGGGFKIYLNLTRKIDKINHALFNGGSNGVVHQVASLVENQQKILIDVEVMKDQRTTRRSASK